MEFNELESAMGGDIYAEGLVQARREGLSEGGGDVTRGLNSVISNEVGGVEAKEGSSRMDLDELHNSIGNVLVLFSLSFHCL